MTSNIQISGEEFRSSLPAVISSNPREKIYYDKISVTNIKQQLKREKSQTKVQLEHKSSQNNSAIHPSYPLVITSSPNTLFFEIHETETIQELKLRNCCSRTIYIHCCGLWNDEARLGAGWRCYPRTRFRIAPGLMSKLFIKAKPRAHSSVPYAWAGLQLAAAHMRDLVTGFFVVPVRVKFLNYVPPNLGECQ